MITYKGDSGSGKDLDHGQQDLVENDGFPSQWAFGEG